MNAFREAWVNACVHNTWTLGIPPTVHFFSDRVEIISNGSIPYSQTPDEFYSGRSMPINESLMRVFIATRICEHTGQGIPVIVESYGEDAFEITGSTVRVTLRYRFEKDSFSKIQVDNLDPTSLRILDYLANNPDSTLMDVSESTGIKRGTLGKIVIRLQDQGYIVREGSKKKGYWKVIYKHSKANPKDDAQRRLG